MTCWPHMLAVAQLESEKWPRNAIPCEIKKKKKVEAEKKFYIDSIGIGHKESKNLNSK